MRPGTLGVRPHGQHFQARLRRCRQLSPVRRHRPIVRLTLATRPANTAGMPARIRNLPTIAALPATVSMSRAVRRRSVLGRAVRRKSCAGSRAPEGPCSAGPFAAKHDVDGRPAAARRLKRPVGRRRSAPPPHAWRLDGYIDRHGAEHLPSLTWMAARRHAPWPDALPMVAHSRMFRARVCVGREIVQTAADLADVFVRESAGAVDSAGSFTLADAKATSVHWAVRPPGRRITDGCTLADVARASVRWAVDCAGSCTHAHDTGLLRCATRAGTTCQCMCASLNPNNATSRILPQSARTAAARGVRRSRYR